MGINFSPFEIGQRALRASQLGLTVAGQNIANVNTKGYTRQDVELSATPASGSNLRLTGNGVTIDGVRALRDQFIDSRLLTETGISGRLTATREALSPVEIAFHESAGGGVNSALTGFFGAFRDLEAHPTSLPLRTAVVESGNQLAAAFNSTSSRLSQIRSDADNLLRATVDEVNSLASRVGDLNEKIRIAETGGANASELIDQRDETIRQLSELAGVRQTKNEDGSITLSLADGKPLALADRAFQIQAQSTPPNGLASLAINGDPAVIGNGRIRGLLDAISEIGSELTALDSLAASIADRVNTAHLSGSDYNGSDGTEFFEVAALGGPVTASNLRVAAAVKADPALVVASARGAGRGDNAAARQISNLLTDDTSSAGTRSGTFSSIYGSIVSDAGEAVRSAQDGLETHQIILTQTLEQRNAVSGVSLDEEAVNLLRYQRAFEAAAKFLKIANELTETIIALGQ